MRVAFPGDVLPQPLAHFAGDGLIKGQSVRVDVDLPAGAAAMPARSGDAVKVLVIIGEYGLHGVSAPSWLMGRPGGKRNISFRNITGLK